MRPPAHPILRLSVLMVLLSLVACAAPLLKPTERLAGHTARVMDLTWSPDGKLVASCGFDGTVRIWDGRKQAPKTVLNVESPWVLSVVWSPDGKRLVSTTNTSVEIWDPATGDKVASMVTGPAAAHGPRNIYAAWSPDGGLLALYGWADGTIRIVKAVDGAEAAVLKGHTAMVSSVEWSKDGKRLVTAGWDKKLRFWDTGSWAEKSHMDIDVSGVIKIAWSPDGKRLSWHGYLDKELVLWDAASEKMERRLAVPAGITSAAWGPDAKMIAIAGGDGVLRVWDASTGKEKSSLGHENRIDRMAWSPDGSRIATVPFSENIVRVWKTGTGEVEPLLGNAGSVTALAWSRDGKLLATGNYDGSVLLWDNF
ncbi:MAG: WD40 repeat domain-containing protein [Deltaproteobacteria bacterium]|nr:WD40 repeat domain-containing protein [Deltaproteobacteria bacterium]